jgi:hypothetical protein
MYKHYYSKGFLSSKDAYLFVGSVSYPKSDPILDFMVLNPAHLTSGLDCGSVSYKLHAL